MGNKLKITLESFVSYMVHLFLYYIYLTSCNLFSVNIILTHFRPWRIKNNHVRDDAF
jgi:hypothetical protein